MKKLLLSLSTVLVAAAVGCPYAEEMSVIDALRVVAVQPNSGIEPNQSVGIMFSAPVAAFVGNADGAEDEADGDKWPVRVLRGDGRSHPVAMMLDTDGRRLRLDPIEPWPAGETLEVHIAAGLVGPFDEPLAIDAPIPFEIAPAPPADRLQVVLRSPRPGRLVPVNLRSIVVVVNPPDAPVRMLTLESESHLVSLPIQARRSGGVAVAELPPYVGPCAPLCPGTMYTLSADAQAPVMRLATIVTTSTQADLTPPRLLGADIEVAGDTARVHIQASEPVRFSGRAIPANGSSIALAGPPGAVPDGWLETEIALEPATEYVIELAGEDLAGNPLDPARVAIRTPAAIEVAISEFVPTPLHDWGDSASAGAPFDATPGGGVVSDADEWIELVNYGATAIDLRTAGLVLRTLDSTPTETRVEHARALMFGAGGDATQWYPGEALVIRPQGTMSQRELLLELFSGRRRLDQVVVGAGESADHVGGRPPDLAHEALSRDLSGRLRWCVPTPGDPVLAIDCL